MLGTLAIVGAPSSGKSTIFNRFLGERRSIVEETPGVTRDRLYAHAEWLTKHFTIIDTGGIQIANAPFQVEIRAQVEIAIEEADVLLFVVDGKRGVTDDDRFVARMLQKAGKPVILAVNKVDNVEELAYAADFYSLGLGDPIAVSGAHGIGIGDLLDKIVLLLPERAEPDYGEGIAFALIGRPNVGKSSLSNRLLGNERTIVSNLAGTTRDSVDTPFVHEGNRYVSIDTAGLVKRGKIYESIDKYAALRALSAIQRAEVVLFLIDGADGLREQDKHVVGYAVEEKKPVIVLVNKWDEAKATKTKDEFTKELRRNFKFLEYAPILYISAMTGEGVSQILPMVNRCHEAYQRRIPTNVLNSIVLDAQEMNPTPDFNHGRRRSAYAAPAWTAPPAFVLVVHDPRHARFGCTRALDIWRTGLGRASTSPGPRLRSFTERRSNSLSCRT